MLYGRKENNRAYLIWGTGGLQSWEGKVSCTGFWKTVRAALAVANFTVTLRWWKLTVSVLDLLGWRVQGLGKAKLFYQDSVKSVFRSFTRSLLLPLVSVEDGPRIIHHSGPTSHLAKQVDAWPENVVLSIFSSLLYVPLGLLFSKEKISDMKTTTHEDISTSEIEVIIWFSANFAFWIVMCLYSTQGEMDRKSGGYVTLGWLGPPSEGPLSSHPSLNYQAEALNPAWVGERETFARSSRSRARICHLTGFM